MIIFLGIPYFKLVVPTDPMLPHCYLCFSMPSINKFIRPL